MKDREPFGLAGLWERWRPGDGAEPVETLTTMTTTPNAVCAPIHNRMRKIECGRRRLRESHMIIRVWRAKVHKGMEVEFWSFIQAQAVPLMHRQPGMTALHVGSLLWGGGEFVMVSTWKDLSALQTFAGEQWRDPVILPGEERFLIRAWVDHYHDQVDSDHRPD